MKNPIHALAKPAIAICVCFVFAIGCFLVFSNVAKANTASCDPGVINVKSSPYNATGDGTTDDTTAISSAITAAAANTTGYLFFPTGSYRVTSNITVPDNVTLSFEKGASLKPDSGDTITINSLEIDAGLYKIFDGNGTQAGFSAVAEVYPEWWGAKVNDTTDDSTAIEKAITIGKVVAFSAGEYYINTTVDIPQAQIRQMKGQGFRTTVMNIATNVVGFQYQRTSGVGGSVLNVNDMAFIGRSAAKTATGIFFKGYGQGYDDNWLRVENCYINGLNKGVDLGYAGQCHFTGNYAQDNNRVYNLTRGASFVTFDSCMNLGNANFIYAYDSNHDAYSNGLMIDKCQSVWGTGADLFVEGWQAVFVTQCGFDLGGGTDAAVWLKYCQDFRITESWIASYYEDNNSRKGIWLDNCHSGVVTDNSIVDNSIGLRVDGISGYNSALTVSGNKFVANRLNDLIFLNTKDARIVNNSFVYASGKAPSHTGTNYEVYIYTAGTDYIYMTGNSFNVASYSILTGANSIVKDNIFSVTP